MLKKCLLAMALAVAITATIAHPASAATAPARTVSAAPAAVAPASVTFGSDLTMISLPRGHNNVRVVSDGTVVRKVRAKNIDFFKILRCAGGIATVALTTVFVAGKALKIVKAVKAARIWVNEVGGAKEAARLLVGATTEAEKQKVLASARKIAGASVMDFFGITQIREGCF